MQDKLEKILKLINLNEDYYEYFYNGCLEKVLIKDNIEQWEMIIKLDRVLPLNVYLELENNIKNVFNKVKIIKIRINPINSNFDELNNYYNYFIDIVCKNNVRYNTFKNRKINLNNNILLIEVYNETEKLKSSF